MRISDWSSDVCSSDQRPAPFAGTVAIDTTPADKGADALAPMPAVAAMPPAEDQQPAPCEEASGAAAVAHPPAAQAVPDVMEDMLAMVGMGDLPAARQDAEAVSVEAPAVGPEMPAQIDSASGRERVCQ